MKSAIDEQGFKAKGRMLNRLVVWERSEREAMEKILNTHVYKREDKNEHHKHQSVEDYKMIMKTQNVKNALKEKYSTQKSELTPENMSSLKSKLAIAEKENADLKEKISQP